MWVSNAAATLMTVPVALAVLRQSDAPHLRVPLLLGIAYSSASIGGMSTPIGTPPNLIFMGQIEALFGGGVALARRFQASGLGAAIVITLNCWGFLA